MVAIETAVNLQTSMQKEFEQFCEWFGTSAKMDKFLQSKKNQQKDVRFLLDLFQEICKCAAGMAEYTTKLQGCLLFYGVSAPEVDFFTRNPVDIIVKEVREALAEGLVQVPEKLQPLMDQAGSEKRWIDHLERDISQFENKEQQAEPDPEPVRFADKPILGIELLKQLTNHENKNVNNSGAAQQPH